MDQAFNLLRDYAGNRNPRLPDLAPAFTDGSEPNLLVVQVAAASSPIADRARRVPFVLLLRTPVADSSACMAGVSQGSEFLNARAVGPARGSRPRRSRQAMTCAWPAVSLGAQIAVRSERPGRRIRRKGACST
jgi:hypothetical protein